jgi:probable HAF family extracellular repeat protein
MESEHNSEPNMIMTKFFNRYYSTAPLLLLATTILCVLLGVTTSQAGPGYVVTELGILPGKKFSVSAAINAQGQVTGTSSIDNSLGEAAFRFNHTTQARLEDLNETTNDSSRGFSINDFGVVAGDATFFSRDPLTRHAAIFSNGTVTDLGTLPKAGSYSRANGINSLGQVVGFAGPTLDTGTTRAFVWTKSGGMQDIGTLGGLYAQAYAINDSGAITGNSQTANSRAFNATHAFFYQFSSNPSVASVMRDLGTLGGTFSTGTAISNKNHVVGYSTFNNTDNRVHAFLHDGVRIRDLGTLSGLSPSSDKGVNDQSVALGVSTNDTVVGYTYLANEQALSIDPGQQVGFIYRNGFMTDLNVLIPSAAQERYIISSATDINDKGQIAATAVLRANGELRAVLLTPAGAGK